MAYCCSQCSFKAQFESALIMHHQLHHMGNNDGYLERSPTSLRDKLESYSRVSPPTSPFPKTKNRGLKLPARTSSATRLLGKLKARICKSKTLFSHPEELAESTHNINTFSPSECTSKAMKGLNSMTSAITCLEDQRETYGCHLCSFEADRITVLDRHLLNHHKIGLESLLQLVMAKTKDGLSDDHPTYGIKLPYYKPQDEIIEEGEFIIETIAPKIKILKHSATNTEKEPSIENIMELDIFSQKPNDILRGKSDMLERNCQMISKEIEDMLNGEKKHDNEEFLSKMKTLNDYMCKFVDSSNALKKVLAKELDSKMNVKEYLIAAEPYFNLGLGDRDPPRTCDRAQSEKMERNRNRYGECCRGDKTKPSASACAESFYF